jgi:hypothetical protein
LMVGDGKRVVREGGGMVYSGAVEVIVELD